MKIAVVGAGFTGLAAGYHLSKAHHNVTLFEKENRAGGLAGTFILSGWNWPLEKHYHHWFTNDSYALSLIKELGLGSDLVFPHTLTSIYYDGKTYPFNSPHDVLSFSPLTFGERLRVGIVTLTLKLLPKEFALRLEQTSAYDWLKKWYGKRSFSILWEPLLAGKFGPFAKTVNMSWFWARIKKRTPKLGYLKGGYDKLIEALVEKIERNGGKIKLNSSFEQKNISDFDKVIITTPSFVFTHIFPNLPISYTKTLTSIPHLSAFNLLLVTKEKILPDIYWLNVNDRTFPFIAVVQQTNLVEKKYYNNQHITWAANYLPEGHPYFKMTKEELLKIYLPYLKKINPQFNWQSSIINYQLFLGPFAQPVFPVNYSRTKPDFHTPIPNVYLANMDMVYPWDRGTNYAIELGYQVAELVEKE